MASTRNSPNRAALARFINQCHATSLRQPAGFTVRAGINLRGDTRNVKNVALHLAVRAQTEQDRDGQERTVYFQPERGTGIRAGRTCL